MVEDDAIDFQVLARALRRSERKAYQLEHLATAEAARSCLLQTNFDAVLVDENLGGARGLDLIRGLGGRDHQAPFILVTGSARSDLDLEALDAGATNFLNKGHITTVDTERAILFAIEQHRHHKALKDTQARLSEALDQAQTLHAQHARVVAMLTHDIRTPLQTIVSAGAALEEAACDHRDMASVVTRTAGKMDALLRQMLDFEKLSDGAAPAADPSAVSLADLARDLSGAWAAPAARKGLAFEVTCQIAQGRRYLTDGEKLWRVLTNLISNAVKFTEQGHVRVSMVPTAPVTDGAETIRFTVADTGPGLTAAECDRVFEPYVQTEVAGGHPDGVGLGLAIVQSLTEALGARIAIDSAPGQGCRFWFDLTLPLAGDRAPLAGARATVTQAVGQDLAGCRVLVAEDDDLNRKLICDVLGRSGCDVIAVRNGREAVTAAQGAPLDLALMDAEMPSLGGLEATRQIRALDGEPGRLPIVMLTGNVIAANAAQFSAVGAQAQLIKPVPFQDLLEAVRAHRR